VGAASAIVVAHAAVGVAVGQRDVVAGPVVGEDPDLEDAAGGGVSVEDEVHRQLDLVVAGAVYAVGVHQQLVLEAGFRGAVIHMGAVAVLEGVVDPARVAAGDQVVDRPAGGRIVDVPEGGIALVLGEEDVVDQGGGFGRGQGHHARR